MELESSMIANVVRSEMDGRGAARLRDYWTEASTGDARQNITESIVAVL